MNINRIFRPNILLFCLSLLLFCSCEQTVEGDLSHNEQIVIQAVLEQGQPIQRVSISRTLPPLQQAQRSDSYIPNAQVSISVNGVDRGEGIYDSGNYFSDDKTPLEAGDSVHIIVKYNSMTASASTIIPQKPIIDYLSGYLYDVEDEWYENGTKSLYFFAHISNRQPNHYYIGQYFNNNNFYYWGEQPSGPGESYTERVPLVLEQYYYPFEGEPNYQSVEEINELFVVDAFPMDFIAYWNSRYDDSGFDGLFSSDGQNPVWNVKGGMGIFLSKNQVIFRSSDYEIRSIDKK